MILLLDTSHHYLVVALATMEATLVDSIEQAAPRQQSELALPAIDDLLKRNHVTPEQIKTVVVTRGPGSYTGVRIALTIAKVLGSLADIPVYTVNTLLSLSGARSGVALIDARANRVYGAVIEQGVIQQAAIWQCAEVPKATVYFGDAHLIGQADNFNHLANNMLAVRDQWQLVADIDHLVPDYEKEISAYAH